MRANYISYTLMRNKTIYGTYVMEKYAAECNVRVVHIVSMQLASNFYVDSPIHLENSESGFQFIAQERLLIRDTMNMTSFILFLPTHCF